MNLAFCVKGAAEKAELPEVTIRNWIRDGVLPARKTGRRIVILENDLRQVLENLPRYERR